MKKIHMLFLAAIAAFSLASCSESIIDEPNNDMILNITVADLDGASTKAVKTGWVSGDKINVWYDGNWDQKYPDLVIKYDGAKWDKDASATLSGNEPAASGTIKYVYEGHNDWSIFDCINQTDYMEINAGPNLGLLFGSEPSVTTAYTYDADILSFAITAWKPLCGLQVVVTGIDPSKYQLKCDELAAGQYFIVTSDEIGLMSARKDSYTNGKANDDGAAFYFWGLYTPSWEAIPSSKDLTFTLMNMDTKEEYTYTALDKSVTSGTFTAVTIPFSSFVSKY